MAGRCKWWAAVAVSLCFSAALAAADIQHKGMPNEAVDLLAANAKGEAGGADAASMESLLHWAIEHSDPAVLKQTAAELNAINSLQDRKKRVKELIDIMQQQPSETELMKDAITILNHPDATDSQIAQTLSALQVLVEPIDNANDLKSLGAIEPIVRWLSHTNSTLQAATCYLLGTAASNNPTFQKHLLAEVPDIMTQLAELATSEDTDVVVKSLYAAAAMVRNLPEMRQAFYAAGGVEAVVAVLTRERPEHPEVGSLVGLGRDVRKALSLLVDLVRLDPAMAGHCLQQGVPATITSLLGHPDADLQEKALDGLITILRAHPIPARNSFNAAGAGPALDHLAMQLKAQQAAETGDEEMDMGEQYYEYVNSLLYEARGALDGSIIAGHPAESVRQRIEDAEKAEVDAREVIQALGPVVTPSSDSQQDVDIKDEL